MNRIKRDLLLAVDLLSFATRFYNDTYSSNYCKSESLIMQKRKASLNDISSLPFYEI